MYFESPLSILGKCRAWYMDTTFAVVRPPYYQLFCIHGFLDKDDNGIQFPLVFVLMSSRTTEDYKEVLSATKDLVGPERCLERVILDFEVALCRAVEDTFRGVACRGCFFHLCQAMCRKLSKLGHRDEYAKVGPVRNLIRTIMVLPFLPTMEFPTLKNVISFLSGNFARFNFRDAHWNCANM